MSAICLKVDFCTLLCPLLFTVVSVCLNRRHWNILEIIFIIRTGLLYEIGSIIELLAVFPYQFVTNIGP